MLRLTGAEESGERKGVQAGPPSRCRSHGTAGEEEGRFAVVGICFRQDPAPGTAGLFSGPGRVNRCQPDAGRGPARSNPLPPPGRLHVSPHRGGRLSVHAGRLFPKAQCQRPCAEEEGQGDEAGDREEYCHRL